VPLPRGRMTPLWDSHLAMVARRTNENGRAEGKAAGKKAKPARKGKGRGKADDGIVNTRQAVSADLEAARKALEKAYHDCQNQRFNIEFFTGLYRHCNEDQCVTEGMLAEFATFLASLKRLLDAGLDMSIALLFHGPG